MRTFCEIFEAYGGDYQTTMDRFMGSEPMYLKFLDMLFEDQSLAQLGEALRASDLDAAFEAAHALKGAVGNMGLTPLFHAVCAIVEPLRAGEQREDYLSLYQTIRSEYQKAEALRTALRG